MSNKEEKPLEDVQIPWKAACHVFKYQLIRKFVENDGMSAAEAALHIYEHLDLYDEKMDSYFKEFIKELDLKWTM